MVMTLLLVALGFLGLWVAGCFVWLSRATRVEPLTADELAELRRRLHVESFERRPTLRLVVGGRR